MGQGLVKQGGDSHEEVSDVYVGAVKAHERKRGGFGDAMTFAGGMEGGCGCGGAIVTGALDRYSGSGADATKDAFIKDVLAMAKEDGVELSGQTTGEKLVSYLGHLKKPVEKGAEDRCRKLAAKINAAYGDVIDTSLPIAELCTKIVEVLASFRAGMHAEFLSVYNDVRTALQNLSTLNAWVEEQVKDVENNLTSDTPASSQIRGRLNLLKDLEREIKFQLQLLANLMSSGNLESEASSLAKAAARSGDINKQIELLAKNPVGRNLSTLEVNMRRGVTFNALMADHYQKILKSVGMTVAEFKQADTIEKLKEAIVKGALNAKSLSSDIILALKELLKIFANPGDREKFIAFLDGQVTGSGVLGPMYGGDGVDAVYGGDGVDPVYGGASWDTELGRYDDNGYPRSDIDRREDAQTALRDMVLSVFTRAVNERFNAFVAALNVLSRHVGKEINAGESLREFIQLLGRVNNNILSHSYVYYALIGYYNDAMSKQVKDEFVGNLNMLIRAIDGMLALPDYSAGAQYFRDVKDSLIGVVGVIDKYSDEIRAKFGSAEHKAGGFLSTMSPSSVQTIPLFTTLFLGAGDDREEGQSGDDAQDPLMEYTGGAPVAQTVAYRPSRTITDAITAFTYNARAALIRKNIESAAADTVKHNEGQTQMNASTIMEHMNKCQEKQLAYRELIIAKRAELKKALPAPSPLIGTEADLKAAEQILDEAWSARKGFWAVVESMDNCMRQFTDSMLTSGADVKDIDDILKDAEVIADWPGRDTGNMLAEIFEQFPTALSIGAGGATAIANSDVHVGNASHYYEDVAGKAAVGSPFMVQKAEAAKKAWDKADTFIRRMTALKNLFSVFIRFGKAVGRENLSADLMSPAAMYRNTLYYLRASAFAQGFANGLNPYKTDAGVTKVEFTDAFKLDANGYTGAVDATVLGAAVAVGVNDAAGANDAARMKFGIRMRGIGQALQATELMDWSLEDEYFIHMIKAAASKILTVTGTYALFSRPSEISSSVRIAPVRMILGGAEETPEVIPEATALYLRLPLIVQWYRRLFNGEDYKYSDAKDMNEIPLSKGGQDDLKISYVPDIDGTFAGLIRLIFRDLRAVDTAAYTDTDIRAIVREVNLIYQKSVQKHTTNVVRGTIADLVNEVNRRYGIVNKADFDKTFKRDVRGYEYNTMNYNEQMADADIAILPGEDGDYPERLTPWQRMFEETSTGATANRKSRFALTKQYTKLVKDFRCAIDRMLEGDGEIYQFDSAISSAQRELRTLTGADKRFSAVATLVRGSDLRSRVDGMRYVMFNETVVASLNALSAIHTMLKRFQTRMMLCNYHALAKHVQAARAGNANTAGLVVAVWTSIKAANPWIDNTDENRDFLRRVFGWNGQNAGGPLDADYIVHGVADQHGVLAAARGFPAGDIAALYSAERKPSGAAGTEWETVRTYFRNVFDNKFVMREIIESVAGLSDGAMITASISDNRMVVSFGGVEEAVRGLFASAFYFLNLLRSSVDGALITRWTDKMYPGSFYWLQEQLIEKMLVGRDSADGSDGQTSYFSLDKVSRAVGKTWDRLVAPSKLDAAAAESRESYADVFAAALFYDAELQNSGLMGSSVAADGAADAQVMDYRTNAYEELIISGPTEKRVLDTRFAARFKQLYTWAKEFTLNRSLLFDFNQLVAKFIQSFYDVNNRKIYNGLIDKFANGSFAQAVNDPVNYAYPDCVPAIQVKFGPPTAVAITQAATLSGDAPTERVDELNVIVGQALAGKPSNYLATGEPGFTVVAPVAAAIGTAPAGVFRFVIDMLLATRVRYGDATLKFAAGGTLEDGAGAALAPAAGSRQEIIAEAWDYLFSTGGAFYVMGVVARVFPFKNNIGDDGTKEREERVALLVGLLLAGAARKTAQAADTPELTAAHLITSLRNGAYNVPSDGRPGAPKYTVVGDDIITMDDSRIAADSLSPGSVEKSTLVYARTGAIVNAIGPNSYNGLGGRSDPEAGTRRPATDVGSRKFGQRADPDADHVLFASLAVTLKTLVSSKSTTGGASVFLVENIAELPQHMKERMRANLPAFKRYIAELARRCELYKSIIARGVVDLSRTSRQVNVAGAVVDPVNPWPYVLAARNTESGANRNRFGGIIDAISRGCDALLQSIEQTLREVGDEPKYMEFYQGFLRDYTTQNGVSPFAPLSSSLAILKNGGAVGANGNAMNFFPVHAFGEPQFKMMYATRGLLGDSKPTMESVTSFADIVQQYNAIVNAQMSVDNINSQSFLDRFVAALRWLAGARTRGLLSHYHCDGAYAGGAIARLSENAGTIVRRDLVEDDPPAAGPARGKHDISLFNGPEDAIRAVAAIRKPIEDTVRQTESSMRDEKIVEFVNDLYKCPNKEPADIVIQNMLDLDIVPINVHALGREVPFSSLLNYSYSFDRMIIEMFYGISGADDKNVKKIIGELCSDLDPKSIRSSKDMMVALLVSPYAAITASMLPHLEGMFRGAVAMDGLARPKFLSDELYGKAIFGEVYCEGWQYNEMGPGAANGAAGRSVDELTLAVMRELVLRTLKAQHNGTANAINTLFRHGNVVANIDKLKLLAGAASRYYMYNRDIGIDALAAQISKLIDSGEHELHHVLLAGRIAAGANVLLNAITTQAAKAAGSVSRAHATNAAGAVDAAGLAATKKIIDDFSRVLAFIVVNAYNWAKTPGHNNLSYTTAVIDVATQAAGLTGLSDITAEATIAAIADVTKVHSTLGHDNTLLHYLGEGSDDLDGKGATLQPDNANVIDSRQVKTVDVGALGATLLQVGAMRFDTVLVRNLVFIVNLLRALRVKLTHDVFYGKGSVLAAKANISPALTELYGNTITKRK